MPVLIIESAKQLTYESAAISITKGEMSDAIRINAVSGGSLSALLLYKTDAIKLAHGIIESLGKQEEQIPARAMNHIQMIWQRAITDDSYERWYYLYGTLNGMERAAESDLMRETCKFLRDIAEKRETMAMQLAGGAA